MRFVVKNNSSGKYMFNVVATNGEVVATSESYNRKQSALETIETLKRESPQASVEDQTAMAGS